ncbi:MULTISPECIES: type VI secretion system baseplate subunit TssE [Acinetobacter]|mgnify:FL=1|jgi:type VI secretion system protein ImpF|uniref:Type VI secretion system baseplate subunit TssE n=1 Tax=Acinetobacter towneri TaxID=202956 RepID=A0AAP9GTA5_9GAMM|nr:MULTISPECIES: type VI secretion system baseplate subunit TssE [Acinetobacter]ENV70185.1 type VI secretion system lysozyme-like protein [Acinetobacter towneri DSM 14962 = CIP 107472]MCA4779013.1 type VI secretion system baseplate subunit TssE [Acinetobacter towneri]MCA4784341.1 type VI secretion system baseplate subunit TssE [Acinetobacter towneri]MCA4786802.1 type VI secretion system baseplate subunit TssE [Acinetobacter towneri]MCA4795560.1 type VI secretion system baseplate subunit TssE [
MNLDHLYPYGFRSTLFDRLFAEQENGLSGMSIQQLRESVARDLEDLLNSRIAKFDRNMDEFPLVKKSILQFGIIDFIGLSTANPLDRDKICQSIEQSITAHEPRLKQIKVDMLFDGHNMGALCLSIQAYLNIHPLYEPVFFDALLKPTTQQYVISARA